MGPDRECNVEVTLAKHLDLATFLDKTCLSHVFRGNALTSPECLEPLDVQHRELNPVRVPEALQLWHLLEQWRLTSLKPWTDLGSGFETLRTATCGLTASPGFASSDTDLPLLGAFRWTEMM